MTQKVNGFLYQGKWFEKDTSILHVTATFVGDGFLDDSIDGPNQQIMRIMQTRGTVIGYNVVSDTVAAYMFGHAAGAWSMTDPVNGPDVLTELADAIDGIQGVTAGTSFEVFEGFVGANPATMN